jgi:hypothetical protein
MPLAKRDSLPFLVKVVGASTRADHPVAAERSRLEDGLGAVDYRACAGQVEAFNRGGA